jgi:hypothetical protein
MVSRRALRLLGQHPAATFTVPRAIAQWNHRRSKGRLSWRPLSFAAMVALYFQYLPLGRYIRRPIFAASLAFRRHQYSGRATHTCRPDLASRLSVRTFGDLPVSHLTVRTKPVSVQNSSSGRLTSSCLQSDDKVGWQINDVLVQSPPGTGRLHIHRTCGATGLFQASNPSGLAHIRKDRCSSARSTRRD